MQTGDKQSATTGISALIGGALGLLAAKYGLNLSPDTSAQVTQLLMLVGAGAVGTLGHFAGGAVHKSADAAATPPASSGGTKAAVAMLAIGASMLLGLSGLSGCAAISKLSTPAAQPFVQVAVDVAVSTAVGTNAATQKGKAMQIKAIAQAVLAADTGTAATLAALQGVVNAKVASLNLPPADLAAAQLLTATISAVIQTQLGSSTAAANMSAQTQVAVSQLMNDVINATSVYGV